MREIVLDLNKEPEKKTCIYIMFSSTSSKMGWFIRFMTRCRYNHVSLSLEKDMHKMYSFARYYKNIPLAGGFVEESSLRYLNQYNDPALVKICKIPVSQDKYDKVIKCINDIQDSSEQYIYNTFSAALVPVHKKLQIDKAYTCLEFVSLVLDKCQIENGISSNKFYSIEDLEQLFSKYMVFNGSMSEFAQFADWGNDCYYIEKNWFIVCISTIRHFRTLFHRMIFN